MSGAESPPGGDQGTRTLGSRPPSGRLGPPGQSSPPDLGVLADLLLEAETSRSLLSTLEDLLRALGAMPARLFLADADTHSFYAAAGLGCPRETDDLPLEGPHPPGAEVLVSRNLAVGLLVPAGRPADPIRFGIVCALLGPALTRLHHQEGGVRELRHVRELNTHLIAAGNLLGHLDIEVLLVKILETVLAAVDAQVGALLVPGADGRLSARVTWGLKDEHLDRIRTAEGERLVDAVFTSGRSVCLDAKGIGAQLRLEGLEARLESLLALPLTARGTARGLVLLANPQGGFDAAQQAVAETVCSMAAIALDNALLVKATLENERLKQEMDLARSVQEEMFPRGGLAIDAWVVDGMSRSCSETGGDYYHFQGNQGQLLAMVGDVSGHGLGAALFTTMAHVLVQQQVRSGARLEPLVRCLNEGLFHTQSGRFMTAAMVAIDPGTGAFRYVSAGHNPLLWIHQGEIRWLESCGLPLGILDQGEWPEAAPGTLAPGDLLVLYTDGFVEAASPAPANEVFSDQRFADLIQQGWREGLDPSGIMRLVNEGVDRWCPGGAHADDLTMVVVRRDR